MREFQIKNFDLVYDGMYFIKWDNHLFRAFLGLNTILQMLKIEGLSNEDVDNTLKDWKPIHFNKVTLVVNGTEKNGRLSLLSSDFSDEYLGKKNLTMIDLDLLS